MTIRDFFGGFCLDCVNLTICSIDHDTLISGAIYFSDADDYKLQELDKLGDRLIESWFVNLSGELFITVF